MLRDLTNKGLASIMEIIVTSVVFIIAAAGILTTVTMFRPVGQESSRKIEAAYIGKGVIDELRRQISAATWNNGAAFNLQPGNTYSMMINGYNVTYWVTLPFPGSDVRRLDMNVSWPDP